MWNSRKLYFCMAKQQGRMMLFMIAFLLLPIQPTVPQVVKCYSNFSLNHGTCSDFLGQVTRKDCCMNPAYGYQEQGNVCKSCRYPQWSEWSSWGACSVSCLEGVRQRRRACYGMGECQDPYKIGHLQTEPCIKKNCCEEPGGWSEWSAWLPCSVTCESGVQKRKRTCTEPPPKCGGSCLGRSEETKDCNTGAVCPTHGGWSSWGPWHPCVRTCQEEGYLAPEQHRHRTCTNPPPSPMPRGNNCTGAKTDSQLCKGLPFCPVNGNWGAWSMASDCSVTCGVGRQILKRKCDPPPKHGGRNCQGDDTKALLCTIPVYCPADGHWSEWSEWTYCMSPNNRQITCKNRLGKRKRERYCLGREYEGNFCPGKTVDFGTCYNISNCKSGRSEQIVGAAWSEWGEWSYCKPGCGENSKQTREKTCTPDLSKYSDQNIDLFMGTPDINCPKSKDTKETRSCLNVPDC